MQSNLVTVCRTTSINGLSITESASAPLPDDLSLDPTYDALQRGAVAEALFSALPSIKAKQIPPCRRTNLPN